MHKKIYSTMGEWLCWAQCEERQRKLKYEHRFEYIKAFD